MMEILLSMMANLRWMILLTLFLPIQMLSFKPDLKLPIQSKLTNSLKKKKLQEQLRSGMMNKN